MWLNWIKVSIYIEVMALVLIVVIYGIFYWLMMELIFFKIRISTVIFFSIVFLVVIMLDRIDLYVEICIVI